MSYSLKKLAAMAQVLAVHPHSIDAIVETGTFKADFITRARSLFNNVHTIERDGESQVVTPG